jgi:hypothetical protein
MAREEREEQKGGCARRSLRAKLSVAREFRGQAKAGRFSNAGSTQLIFIAKCVMRSTDFFSPCALQSCRV